MLHFIYENIVTSKVYSWIVINILSKIRLPFKKGVDLRPLIWAESLLFKQDESFVLSFVATDRWKLSSFLVRLLTKGKFSHAGILLLFKNQVYALHADVGGVKIEPLEGILKNYTDFSICVFNLDKKGMEKANKRIDWLLDNIDKLTYDFAQESGYEAMYCSELNYYVLNSITDIEYVNISGKSVITPQCVYDQCDCYKNWRTEE